MTDRVDVMLAKSYETRLLRRFRPPYIVQAKLNGLRCRAVPRPDDGGYMLLTSSAQQAVGTPHLVEQVNKSSRPELELDGEFYIHGEPLRYIQGIVKRTVNLHPEYDQMDFYIFDVITDAKQTVRLDILETIDLDGPNLIKVPSYFVDDYEGVLDILAQHLAKGYEGVIIRDAWAYYERKKSFNLLKLKPEEDDFFLIVGYREEVSIDGDLKNRLGSVWCEDHNGTRFYVGSGFDATEREALWEDRENLINKICHVKYTELRENGKPTEAVVIDILSIEDVEEKIKLIGG